MVVSESHSVMSNSLEPHGLQHARLLCPWKSSARILEWVAVPFSGDLPNPGIERALLHCKQILYQLSYATREAIMVSIIISQENYLNIVTIVPKSKRFFFLPKFRRGTNINDPYKNAKYKEYPS